MKFTPFFYMFLMSAMAFNVAAKDDLADVAVKDAWVRTTCRVKRALAAFMTITAKSDLQLVGASSPVAGVTEVHEMKMSGDVMQMRAIPSLDLPAGKAVALVLVACM